MRIKFFLFFVNFFNYYSQYKQESDSFNASAFINVLPESYQPFVKEFVGTQLFEGLIQMYEKVDKEEDTLSDIEEEMKNLVTIIKDCMCLLQQEDGISRIFTKLHPNNWEIRDVNLPSLDYTLSDEYNHFTC